MSFMGFTSACVVEAERHVLDNAFLSSSFEYFATMTCPANQRMELHDVLEGEPAKLDTSLQTEWDISLTKYK